MKNTRKFFAMVLAVVMVMSLATTAFADEGEATATTYSITINNSATGHIYEAYQIFTGDLAKDAENDDAAGTNAVLSNIKWGANANQTGEVSEVVLENLTIETAISYVDFSKDPVATSTDAGDTYVISGLVPGYYLIKDKDGSVSGNDAYTSYIIEVVENSTVTPKSDVPEVEKKVKDTNDSTDETTGWQDSADYDIGDSVPFQLKATLANNVSAYDTYKIVFHDTLSAGLTYNNDAKVTFNGTDVTSYFTITESNGELTISCNNVKAFGASDSDEIIVTYTATLNENAKIGAEGNPNEVYLEYSNNPNWDDKGNNGKDDDGDGETDEPDEDEDEPTGETPEDKVIVFTFQVDVTKYADEVKDGNELVGAGFTLYKWEVVTEATEDTEAVYDWVAVGEELTGDAVTEFVWTGLDDGNYKLVETTTPAGYNTIAPIEFTITAEHDVLSDNPALTSLTGNVTSGEATFTPNVTAGSLSTDVVNKSGATLPETGGMGTTLFYVFGAVMVLAAVVLLVTKKRMANAE